MDALLNGTRVEGGEGDAEGADGYEVNTAFYLEGEMRVLDHFTAEAVVRTGTWVGEEAGGGERRP